MGIEILCFLALGAVVGLIAPAAGIAGGLFMVPAFLFLLPRFGVPDSLVAHLAAGSSLAAAALMGVSSVRAHAQAGNVYWPAIVHLAPGLIAGAVAGGLLSHALAGSSLEIIFAILLLAVAGWLFAGFKPRGGPEGMLGFGWRVLVPSGFVIGGLGALLGIGGGIMLVPLLIFGGLTTARASGSSSTAVFVIVLTGAITYLLAGMGRPDLPAWTAGYLYGPAVLATAASAMLFAPLGARLGRRLPPLLFKRLFALLLLGVAIKLLV